MTVPYQSEPLRSRKTSAMSRSTCSSLALRTRAAARMRMHPKRNRTVLLRHGQRFGVPSEAMTISRAVRPLVRPISHPVQRTGEQADRSIARAVLGNKQYAGRLHA